MPRYRMSPMWQSTARWTGVILMLASGVLWLALDYPNLLPISLAPSLPAAVQDSPGDWILVTVVSCIGWLFYTLAANAEKFPEELTPR